MALKISKLGTALAVGAIDIATDYIDEQMGLTEEAWNSKNIFRIGGFAFGLLDSYFLHMLPGDISETLVLSTLPLVERTVYELVKGAITPTATRRVVTRVVKREVPPPVVRKLEIIGER